MSEAPRTVLPASEPASFWRSVGQSLRGEPHDYTSERLNRAVFLLAVPMVLEMVMESLFAVADVFWVSRLGKDAVAVVGITESIMTFIYAVAIGISIAATAIVSRRIGEKDAERAAHAAGQVDRPRRRGFGGAWNRPRSFRAADSAGDGGGGGRLSPEAPTLRASCSGAMRPYF